MSTSNSQPPSPPTTACIGLSATALIVFVALLFPALYVVYKHRKIGQAWFPPFIIFFIFRITSEIYYLSRRNEPDTPTTYAMVAAAASTATLSATIVGLIYEALNLPLFPYKRQRNRIVVIAMNVVYNIGTILAAYGGTRDITMPDRIKNGAADKAGNIIMFLVMIGTLAWLYPAGKHIYYARQDISYRSAEVLMMAAAPATVLQLIRMNYDLIYSFTQIAQLHPTTGSFAIRFVTFFLQLSIVGMVIVAGWFSKDAATIRARVLKTDSTSDRSRDSMPVQFDTPTNSWRSRFWGIGDNQPPRQTLLFAVGAFFQDVEDTQAEKEKILLPEIVNLHHDLGSVLADAHGEYQSFYTRLETTYTGDTGQLIALWLCSLHGIVALCASCEPSPNGLVNGQRAHDSLEMIVLSLAFQSNGSTNSAYLHIGLTVRIPFPLGLHLDKYSTMSGVIDSIHYDTSFGHWQTVHTDLAVATHAFRDHIVRYAHLHQIPEMENRAKSLGEGFLDYDKFMALPMSYMVDYENLVVGNAPKSLAGKEGLDVQTLR
ncbi:hypothetical protein FSPOR_5272 [Fusarium sporotrichioides]|uniref:DUF7702 domain-containing protein n=1 Tax=Fusarium sporotrichioides TaxID=5514 RepID=A0A395S7Z4_FUSSP|nr:hypothetical protein FSPOR_5272 [Fusarium sporotrichioides]